MKIFIISDHLHRGGAAIARNLFWNAPFRAARHKDGLPRRQPMGQTWSYSFGTYRGNALAGKMIGASRQ